MKKVTFIAPDNFGWNMQEVIGMFAKAGKEVMPEQIIELGMHIVDDESYGEALQAERDGPDLPDNWDDIDENTEEGQDAYADVDEQRDELADNLKDSIKDVVCRFLELDADDENLEEVLDYLAYNFSPRMEDQDLDTIAL